MTRMTTTTSRAGVDQSNGGWLPHQGEGMSTVKRIVCLANARKEGERCLAGKELLPDGRSGAWIRPISDQRDNGALVEHERVYVDRTEPALLDIVNIPCEQCETRMVSAGELGSYPRQSMRKGWPDRLV